MQLTWVASDMWLMNNLGDLKLVYHTRMTSRHPATGSAQKASAALAGDGNRLEKREKSPVREIASLPVHSNISPCLSWIPPVWQCGWQSEYHPSAALLSS